MKISILDLRMDPISPGYAIPSIGHEVEIQLASNLASLEKSGRMKSFSFAASAKGVDAARI